MNFYFVFGYLAIINIIGIYVMGYDKKKARKGEWRVKERTIFGLALLGGSLGVLYGGKRYRHKTKHPSFKYGIPLILIIQIIIISFGLYHFQEELFA